MRNKITIIIIIIACLLVGVFIILQLLDTKEPPNEQVLDNANNSATETTNENEENRQIFDTYGIHDQNMIQYGSTKYDFTIDIPREFYCSLTPDVLWGANTALCRRLNSNSSDGQDDYLFIEIFSTGYNSLQAGKFEEWYANGIAKYFARELNEVVNKDVPYQLTHETMTGGMASYVYFSTDQAVVSIGSADVSEAEIIEIANSFRWVDNLKSDSDIEDDTSDWSTYTQIPGLLFDYPANATVWPDGYNVYGSLSIRKESTFIDNYEEGYILDRRNVNLEPRTTLTEYVDYMISTSGYQDSKKEIGLNGTTAYQFSNLTEMNVYIGTFFQVGEDIYNFYIEQGAPSLAGEMIEELPQSYLDEIEATYNHILNSIEIE
ncbi:MAG: hypothetical protein WC693_02480 [Patescibacteria group bacterium]|jgi:hypothetical protein